eukprot:743835-Pyramimonas_sp.AAC.1
MRKSGFQWARPRAVRPLEKKCVPPRWDKIQHNRVRLHILVKPSSANAASTGSWAHTSWSGERVLVLGGEGDCS